MLIGLFADVHSNLAALDACLRHAHVQGVQQVAFLGDLVGYGPNPAEVVERVANAPEAVVVKGNHDHAVEVEPKTRELNDAAYDAILWTRSQLSSAQRQFLASLPLTVRRNEAYYVHASARNPSQFIYIQHSAGASVSLDASQATYVFCGHVHEPMLYFKTAAGRTSAFRPVPGHPVPVSPRHRWLAIVGSVGQPRDGDPAACYATFDTDVNRYTLFRIPYDHLQTAQQIRRVGLPEIFAERIELAR